MEVLENRLVVWPLRRLSDWIPGLCDALHELATKLDLADEESGVLTAFLDLVPFLTYSQLLRQLDISVSEICWRVRFVYDPEEDESDEFDISLLRYVDGCSDSIEFCIEVTDGAFARYLGVDRLLELPSGRLRISLRVSGSGVEEETTPAPDEVPVAGDDSDTKDGCDRAPRPTGVIQGLREVDDASESQEVSADTGEQSSEDIQRSIPAAASSCVEQEEDHGDSCLTER
jgi:hypothetical protein